MLPKQNRLKKKQDFEKVFKRGKGFVEKFILVKTIGNSIKDSRFGFIVSRKVSKRATTRNKIRRKLREIVKLKLTKVKKGQDVILVIAPKFKSNSLPELDGLVERAFKKAKIFK